MGTMNEFDLQFQIFTLRDTTETLSYMLTNVLTNFLVFGEYLILIAQSVYETSFSHPTVQLVFL